MAYDDNMCRNVKTLKWHAVVYTILMKLFGV